MPLLPLSHWSVAGFGFAESGSASFGAGRTAASIYGGMVMTGMFALMLRLILTSVRQNFSAGERLFRLRRHHLNRSIEVEKQT